MNKVRQQQGIVLISVMIIIALISAIVALAWKQQHENFKLSQYTQTQQQALNYVYSIESWAKSILLNDKDTKIDSLDEDWATEILPIPVFGGQIHGKIIDLQSTLSINNIVNTSNPDNITFYNAFYSCLNRLNAQFEQAQMADLIFAHIAGLLPNIRPFEHISELKNIDGIERQDYYKIKPYLNALPHNIKININTAGKQILSCLNPDLSEYLVEELISLRPFSSPEKALESLRKILPNSQLDNVTFPSTLISTKSQYFVLKATVKMGDNTLVSRTIFHRKNAIINIINRSYYQSQ